MEVWIGRQGERHGPYQEEQVREWLRSGQLSRDDLGWYEGLADWQPLSILFPEEKPVGASFNTYEPPTLQPNATTLVDYAGFWQRLCAWIIDLFVLIIPCMLVMYTFGGIVAYKHLLDQIHSGIDFGTALREYAVSTQYAYITMVVVGYLYYTFFEASPRQATLGKQALRLYVTDLQGQRMSLGRSALRNAVRLTNLYFGLIPVVCYLTVAWTHRKQGLHDLFAGTLVLNGTIQQRSQHDSTGNGQGRFNA